MAKIFLSVPILGKPCLQMIYSMYQAILCCPSHKVRVYFNQNDSLIQRVRNVHISQFLFNYKDCDIFMSIDSDLEILNCYPNNNIFKKLIDHDLEFVGGLYALKKQGSRRCSSIAMDGEPIEYDTGLKEMRWLSSGCFCLKRSMVEKMYDAYKDELLYDGDDNASGLKVLGIYNPMLYDLKKDDFKDVKLPWRKLISEDWSLCQRWRDIGGKIFSDSSIILNHIGEYSYNLWDVSVVKTPVDQQPNLPQPGFDLKDFENKK